MPELPEITHFKKYAQEALLHKKVVKVAFGASKPLQASEKSFRDAFKDHIFKETHQLGKYLFVRSGSGKWLALHFGMSGKLDFSALEELPKHAIITFYFTDDTHFSFVCPRKFGKVWITGSVEAFQKEHSLGPDALQLSKAEFLQIMEDQTAAIKSVLMDQHKLAGIGNVYADEILFQSKVHPKTKVSNLKEETLGSIYSNISKILKEAIEIIENGKEVPSSWLKAHRKEGDTCPDCIGKVEKTVVGGRSTYFCGGCQVVED